MSHTPDLAIPPFRPAPGLGNPHVQTIAGKLLRPELGLPLHRERIDTPDGDFLDLDFAFDPEGGMDPGVPVVVLLHGLEGSARRRYMEHTYQALLDRGLRPVGLNFRGCSGEPNRAARAYHSGETGDLRLVLDRLAGRYPAAKLAVVGYSLGGNVALKYLGEAGRLEAGGADAEDPGSGAEGPGSEGPGSGSEGRGSGAEARDPGAEAATGVSAGAAVSVPFDLAAGARALERSWLGRTAYTRYFMRTLVPKTLGKSQVLAERVDLDAVREARTIREFDDALTAPLHGFRDAADYYARSSSARFIAGIRAPTLVVHSRDDPFLPAAAIPEAALKANPAITAILTEKGGHQGYVAGSVLRPDFWVERVVAEWLAGQLRG